MTRRTELQRLDDMVGAGERAVRHLGGRDRAGLTAEEMRSDAVVRALEVMGEACKHISAAARGRSPAVPWGLIAGIRDRHIHGYDQVDWAVVWDTVTRFVPVVLPELRAVRDAVLAEEPPPPEAP